MFQRILVPLDGSERAEKVIHLAAHIARTTGGAVVFLRVIPRQGDLYLLSVEASADVQDVMGARQDEAKSYLAQLTSSEALEGVDVVAEVIDGAPAEAILAVAGEQKVDLIVMCSHGHTGFKRWVLGSIAQKVAWHSTAPVLVLREGGEMLSGLSPDVGHPIRALVALDGSPFAEAAVMPAAQFVAMCSGPVRGELHLTRLIKLPSMDEEIVYMRLGIDRERSRAALSQADRYLQGVKERICQEMGSELAVDITWSVEECVDVAETLLNMAQGKGEGTYIPSDLIVLTTHGRSALNRWMRGSVAERVLGSTTMPLLIVHPQKHSSAFAELSGEAGQGAPPD